MKKLLCVILSVFVVFCLAACNITKPQQVSPTTQTQEPTTAEPSTVTEASGEPPVSQQPMFSVSVPVITETTTAQDGTVVFTSKYQNISLIVPDPEIADAIIIDFLDRIDTSQANADTIRSAALTEYNGTKDWVPYLNQITFEPKRIDSCVLSFFGNYVTYNGSAHPEIAYLPISYDLLSGKTLRLQDILTADTIAEQLINLVIETLDEQKEEKYLFEDYKETVQHRFQMNFRNDTGWFFSQNGLCFYFAPYDIAPYVSGVIIAEIPYHKLPGVLEDAYFPAETESATGDLKIIAFNEDSISNFTQISEIILQNGGEKAFVYTKEMVSNVRIETGSWNASGTIFTPEHTVFAASALTPGDAVMIEGILPQSLPSLRLQYETNNETVSSFVTCNNNEFTLTSE